jgi:hypothetical protein
MVTTDGRVLFATVVAGHAFVSLDDDCVSSAMMPPINPPITSIPAPAAANGHQRRRPAPVLDVLLGCASRLVST